MNPSSNASAIDVLLDDYARRPNASGQENLVDLLREIQLELGCIPEDVQEQITQVLAVKQTVIRTLIKLYPSLSSSPPRQKITLCVGPSCRTYQAELEDAILACISGKPYLLTVRNCLKQCGTAPNLQIGNQHYPHVRPEDIAGLVKQHDQN